MIKHLLAYLGLFLCTIFSINAQKNIDLEIVPYEPLPGTVYENLEPGDTLYLRYTIRNLGTDGVLPTDTIIFGLESLEILGNPSDAVAFRLGPMTLPSGYETVVSIYFIEGELPYEGATYLVNTPENTTLELGCMAYIYGYDIWQDYFIDPGIDLEVGSIGGNNFTATSDITFESPLAGKVVDLEVKDVIPVTGDTYPNLSDGDEFTVHFTLRNNGTAAIVPTDTIRLVLSNLEIFGLPDEGVMYTLYDLDMPSGTEEAYTITYIEGEPIFTGSTSIVNTPTDATVINAMTIYAYGNDIDNNLFIDEGVDVEAGSVGGNNLVYVNYITFGSTTATSKNIDLEVKDVIPVSGASYPNLSAGDDFTIYFTLKNNGPDAIEPSDTVIVVLNNLNIFGLSGDNAAYALNSLSIASGAEAEYFITYTEGAPLFTASTSIVNTPTDAMVENAFQIYAFGYDEDNNYFTDPGVDLETFLIGGNNLVNVNNITFGSGVTSTKEIDLAVTNVVPASGDSYPNLADGDAFDISFTIVNNGPDDVVLTDTLKVTLIDLWVLGHPGLALTYTINADIPSGSEETFTLTFYEGAPLYTGSEYIVNTPEDELLTSAFSVSVFGYDEAFNYFIDEGIDLETGIISGNNYSSITGVFFGDDDENKNIDLSIHSVNPTSGTTFSNLSEGDAFNLNIAIFNEGPETVLPSDTIIVLLQDLEVLGLPGVDYLHKVTGITLSMGATTYVALNFIEGEPLFEGSTSIVNTPINTTVSNAMSIVMYGYDVSGEMFNDPDVSMSAITGWNRYDMINISFEGEAPPTTRNIDLEISAVTPNSGAIYNNLDAGDALNFSIQIKNNGPENVVIGDTIIVILDSVAFLGHPDLRLTYKYTDLAIPAGSTVTVNRTFNEGVVMGGGSSLSTNTPINTTVANAYRASVYGKDEEGIFLDLGVDFTLGVYPFMGNNTRRISNIKFETSSSVVRNLENELSIQLYPNPTSDNVNIQLEATEKMDLSTKIYDQLGRVVINKQFEINNAGTHQLSIDVSSLVAGVYVLEFKKEGLSHSVKFVVE